MAHFFFKLEEKIVNCVEIFNLETQQRQIDWSLFYKNDYSLLTIRFTQKYLLEIFNFLCQYLTLPKLLTMKR